MHFIEFRKHVHALKTDGVLNNTHDVLLYAIKERQANEIRFNVPSSLFEDTERKLAASVFLRTDVLNADDFEFFISSINGDKAMDLFSAMVDSSIVSEADEVSRHWLKRFLDSFTVKAQPEQTQRINSVKINAYGINELFSKVYQDTTLARLAFDAIAGLSINTWSSASTLRIADYASGVGKLLEGGTLGADRAKADEFFIALWDFHEKPETLACLISNFCLILRALKEQGLTPETDSYARSLSGRTSQLLDLLSEQHNKKGFVEVPGFGSRKAKSANLIPWMARSFVLGLKEADLPSDRVETYATKLVARLFSGPTHPFDACDLKDLVKLVEADVDWDAVVKTIPGDSRLKLAESVSDRSKIILHLTSSERARLLELDFEL